MGHSGDPGHADGALGSGLPAPGRVRVVDPRGPVCVCACGCGVCWGFYAAPRAWDGAVRGMRRVRLIVYDYASGKNEMNCFVIIC